MATQALSPRFLMPCLPALERKDLGASPLGVIGNLQFKTEQGGTARASRAGVRLSDMRRSFAKLWADMKFCFTCVGAERLAQRDYLAQVRANSRRIGDLLGNMTAHANDEKAQASIADGLAQLVNRSQGDLANLSGWQYCVSTYMDELKGPDLKALHNGVLGNKDACKALLDKIPAGEARSQASRMLGEMAAVLQSRCEKKFVQEPLAQMAELLSARQVDWRRFEECLLKLGSAPLDRSLKRSLRSLTEKQLEALLTLTQQEKWNECLGALTKADEHEILYVKDTLSNIRKWLGDIAERRLQVANFLDCLKAPLDDETNWSEISDALWWLGIESTRKEANLWLGQEFLSSYLKKLDGAERMALRDGVLGNREVDVLIVKHDWTGVMREQTSRVMDQLRKVLTRRLIEDFAQEPLEQLSGLLAAHPMDGLKLQEQLISLARGVAATTSLAKGNEDDRPAYDMLDGYLQSLPREQLQPLLVLAQQEKWNDCLTALQEVTAVEVKPKEAERAMDMLNFLHQSLITRSMRQEQERIRQAV
ncbi:hypothetical protein [Alcaligenes sp. Marseille-Q7550]